MSARNTKHQDPNTMENPLELEVVEDRQDDEFQIWIQGYRLGACIGGGKTEKEAIQDAASNLEASLKLIQENPQLMERLVAS